MAVSPSTTFWRQLIEELDEGVLILNAKGSVVYNNDLAAVLLGYEPDEVRGLDKDDLLSLFQLDRMDGRQFASALKATAAPDSKGAPFALATVSNRLYVRLLWFWQDDGPVTVILLRENTQWRAQLLTDTFMRVMRGPLDLALDSAQALSTRLEEGWLHVFELKDLARISRDSVRQALGIWETLIRLETTDPTYTYERENQSLALRQILATAYEEVAGQSGQSMPILRFEIPGDLPPVLGAENQIHAAFCALFEVMAARWDVGEEVVLNAVDRKYYIQVTIGTNDTHRSLPPYLFDSLPLAITEQVIIQHGGRIWFEGAQGERCVFSLPVDRA